MEGKREEKNPSASKTQVFPGITSANRCDTLLEYKNKCTHNFTVQRSLLADSDSRSTVGILFWSTKDEPFAPLLVARGGGGAGGKSFLEIEFKQYTFLSYLLFARWHGLLRAFENSHNIMRNSITSGHLPRRRVQCTGLPVRHCSSHGFHAKRGTEIFFVCVFYFGEKTNVQAENRAGCQRR